MRCPGCRSVVRGAPTFCASCGYRLEGREPDPQRGALLSILISVLGVYAVLIGLGWLSTELWIGGYAMEDGTVPGALLAGFAWLGGLGLVTVLALLPLRLERWRACFPLSLDVRGALLGVAGGVAALIASTLYLGVLLLFVDEVETEGELADPLPFAVTFVVVVLFPAVVEELADRGVLWEALRRITGVGGTIVASALVFAFLHGLGEGAFFEIPHRFTMGLVFGWLRARTGSLAPCMVAHGTNNLLALLLVGG